MAQQRTGDEPTGDDRQAGTTIVKKGLKVDVDSCCKKLVKFFKGTPFLPIQAQAVLDQTIDETLATLARLHEIGCCRCPINDGGMNLFSMTPEEVRLFGQAGRG